GNHAEHLSRLLVHPLTMQQVAGILVSNLEADGARRWPEPETDEELRGILYCPGETGGGLASTRIIAQLYLVFLHVRAAAGRVDHHGVEALPGEGVHGQAGELFGRLCLPRMRGESTAADARGGHDDVAAVARQREGGPAIRAPKHFVLDASGEQADTGPTRGLCRRHRR